MEEGNAKITMMQFGVTVPGDPKTQGSMNPVGGGKVTHSKALVEWRNRVQTIVLKAALEKGWPVGYEGPVCVDAEFYLRKPAHTKFELVPYGKPDLDKLQRAIGDALAPRSGPGVLKDDGQIVEWKPSKHWETTNRKPGVWLTVTALELE